MEFRLLGEVQAWHDDKPVRLGGKRQRCVLAVLLSHPGVLVPVDRIIDFAWPGDPPLTAPSLVTSYVSRLRGTLSCPDIRFTSRQPGYLASFDPERVDIHRFARLVNQARRDRETRDEDQARTWLREALDLWRGIPLADLDSSWARDNRLRLENMRLDALEELGSIDLAANHPERVIALLRDVVPCHPERQRLAVLAIRALRDTGEPAQAAELATRIIRGLRDSGLDPSSALSRAQTDALNHRVLSAKEPRPLKTGIPATTRVFTGRTRELNALLKIAYGGGDREAAVVAIDGMAGVGKTALAIHLAHQIAARFPDGQLFIDLHGFTPGMAPTPPAEALDRFLRDLGTAAQRIPAKLDERAELYRERLNGTRTLILLDNAANETQVRPLLPTAPGCLVLMTSRSRLLGLDEAHSLQLDSMIDADAADLFRAIAGPRRVMPHDPALADVVALCGFNPLAIRIAAARLRSRPFWPLAYLAELLRDEPQRLDLLEGGDRSLRAAFGISYNHLARRERYIFERLGSHFGTEFDARAIAALTSMTTTQVNRALETLFDHNLLMQRSPGRYQLHDLVRIYARNLAAKHTQTAGLIRLLHYYLRSAEAANRHLARYTQNPPNPPHEQAVEPPRFDNVDQSATWMETELSNLLTAAAHAAERDDLLAYAVALPLAIHGHLRTQGQWNDAKAVHQTAIEAARRAGDLQSQAQLLVCLGELEMVSGYYAIALDTLHAAVGHSSGLGDRLSQANALTFCGEVQRLTRNYQGAEQYAKKALELFAEIGDRLGQANGLILLGALHRLTNRYAEAAQTLVLALTLYRDLNHDIGEAGAYLELGQVHHMTGDLARATAALARALDLYTKLGGRNGLASTLTALGRVHQLNGDHARAAEHHNNAVDLYHRLGNRLGQAAALANLAQVYIATGGREEAAECLERSAKLYRELGVDRSAESVSRKAELRPSCS